jgi:hypothetical protein
VPATPHRPGDPAPAREVEPPPERRGRSVLRVLGMMLLVGVAAGFVRAGVRSGMRHVHWRDPALVRTEQLLEQEIASLRSLESSLGRGLADPAEDERALSAHLAELAGAAEGLEGVAGAAGLEVEARLPPRRKGDWTTEAIRAGVVRDVAGLEGVLARLSLPRGAWVEGVRCSGEGCSVYLSAATWTEEPRRPPAPSQPRQLAPRPSWPPSAEVWDRVEQGNAEVARLLPRINELYARRRVHERRTHLELVAAGAAVEGHRTALARVVAAALEAGLTDVEVTRSGYGVKVHVPRRSVELQARLGALGHAWEDGGTASAVTYSLSFRQPASVGASDLPAGLSLSY